MTIDRDKGGWLGGFLGALALKLFGSLQPKFRNTVNLEFPGFTITDNTTTGETDITLNAEGFFGGVNSALAAANDTIDVNGQKITGLADGEDPTDAVTLQQLEDAIDGVSGGGTVDLSTDVTNVLSAVHGGTGLAALGSGVATWLGTPTSANLYSALSTKTGSGLNVFQDAPTFKTNIQVNNPANTFAYFITPGAISADRILNLPVITGTDTIAVLNLAQTFVAKSIDCATNFVSNIDNACISNSAGIAWGKLGSGVCNLPAATSFVTTVDAKCTLKSREPKSTTTTDASVATLDSFTIASGTALTVTWTVTAIKSDSSQMASYSVTASFKNNGGTVAQVGTTIVTVIGESDSLWDCTIDNSTTTIRLRVTGKAATTITWGSVGSNLEITP